MLRFKIKVHNLTSPWFPLLQLFLLQSTSYARQWECYLTPFTRVDHSEQDVLSHCHSSLAGCSMLLSFCESSFQLQLQCHAFLWTHFFPFEEFISYKDQGKSTALGLAVPQVGYTAAEQWWLQCSTKIKEFQWLKCTLCLSLKGGSRLIVQGKEQALGRGNEG